MSDEPSLADRIAGVEAWVKKRDSVSTATVSSLATQFKLSAKEVRVIIDRARYKLASNAEAYVEAHMESVARGLEIGRGDGRDATAGLRVAQEGAAWALERIGQGHSRVLDAPKAQGATGPQIVIGIQVGGVQTKNTIEPEAIEAESSVTVTADSEDRGETPVKAAIEPTTIVLDRATALPVVEKKKRNRKPTKSQAIERKASAILAAVTKGNAQIMMRSLIDLGYTAEFAWEMIETTLNLEE